ncbi:hypothetical protein J4206_00540, partial [Candidatus Woesearchaeota archaeon]|nr:hypothetical protein [Candidatus Woesearchaeota archaeon]
MCRIYAAIRVAPGQTRTLTEMMAEGVPSLQVLGEDGTGLIAKGALKRENFVISFGVPENIEALVDEELIKRFGSDIVEQKLRYKSETTPYTSNNYVLKRPLNEEQLRGIVNYVNSLKDDSTNLPAFFMAYGIDLI